MKKLLLTFVVLSNFLLVGAQKLVFDDGWWMPNGPVSAIEVDSIHQKLYVGGTFDMVGPRRPWNVLVRHNTGAILSTADQANDTVLICIGDGNGGWYIGGRFTKVGDSIRYGLAQVDSLGKVTAFGAGKTLVKGGDLKCMVLHQGKLYLGGKFSSINGVPRRNLAALDAGTAALSNWQPGPDEAVYSITAAADRIYVAGFFAMIDTAIRFRLAALDTQRGRAFSWNPGVNGNVYSVAVYDTFVFIGGTFSACNYQTAQGFAMFSKNNSKLLKKINHPASGYIYNLKVIDKRLYIFDNYNTVKYYDNTKGEYTPQLIAAYNLSNFTTAPFVANRDYWSGKPLDITKYNNTFYISGNFYNSYYSNDSVFRCRFMAVDSATSSILPLTCNFSQDVTSISASASGIYAVGRFISAGGVSRSNIVRYNMNGKNGKNPEDFQVRVNSTVNAIKCDQDKIYLGGTFTKVNNTSRTHIACINYNTNAVTPFNPSIGSGGDAVYCINTSMNKVLIGGSFRNAGSLSRYNFAITDSSFGYCFVPVINTNGAVRQIDKFGSYIYITGDFYSANSGSYYGLLRADTSTYKIDASYVVPYFGNQGNNTAFTSKAFFRSQSSDGIIVLIDSASKTKKKWDQYPGTGAVQALGTMGNLLFAGGIYQSNNRQNLSAYFIDNNTLHPFNPKPDNAVMTLKSSGKYLYAGGQFMKMSGAWQQGFAVFADQCAAYDTLTTAACTSYSTGNYTFQKSGTYDIKIVDVYGCKINRELNLTIHNTSTSGKTYYASGCNVAYFRGYTYSKSGKFLFYLKNQYGCDSTDTLVVQIAKLNIGVNTYTDFLIANDLNGKYQWMNCDSAYASFPGDTGRLFYPKINGHYAVSISRFGCSDTSACYNFYNPLLHSPNQQNQWFQLSPNPVADNISIQIAEAGNYQFEITGPTGMVCMQGHFQGNESNVTVSQLASGIYFFRMQHNGKAMVSRFVKL